jgi:hypothetical protein
MSAFDLFQEFDDALEWQDDDDLLLEPSPPQPWPCDEAVCA